MIALTQPFSLSAAGGGARILRSLVEEAPLPYQSIYASPFPEDAPADNELRIPRRPYFGSWPERLSRRFGHALEYTTVLSQSRFERTLASTFRRRGVTAVHSIPQGIEYWYTYRVARALGLPFFLTVHDDLSYNLRGYPYRHEAMDRLAEVWRNADERFVISDAMGREYNDRYGPRSYVRVTDGLHAVADAPKPRPSNRLHVYFMGAVHLAYEENFRSLIQALDHLQTKRPSLDVRLSIRGGVPFALPASSIPITVLGWGTQSDVERDMDQVDLLYFPLPFDEEFGSFVRLSLSTKMVTYLGSGLPILFHGPEKSAAGELLSTHNAGISAPTTTPTVLAKHLLAAHANTDPHVRNALALAHTQFRIEEQRRRFWTPILDTLGVSSPPTALAA